MKNLVLVIKILMDLDVSESPSISINVEVLDVTDHFIYMGSTIKDAQHIA